MKYSHGEKRRTPSQRAGFVGEQAFAYFASQIGLLPTKIVEDVGLDYLCQMDEDVQSSNSSTISANVLGACVRASGGVDGRIELTRSDANAVLAANFPVCIVLVHQVPGGPVPYYRLADATFRGELIDFLASRRKTTSLTPGRCKPWCELPRDLLALSGTGFVEEQRLKSAENRLTSHLGSVTLEIRRVADGSLTLVTALDLYAFFEGTDSDAMALATFGAARRREHRIGQLALKRQLLDDLAGLPSRLVLAGFTTEGDRTLRVDGPEGASVREFLYTTNGTHMGWYLREGLAFTVSKRIQEGGVWVHKMRAFADPEEKLTLPEVPGLGDFLACCVPGARLRDSDMLGEGMDVSYFEGLHELRWLAKYLRDARGLPGWREEVVFLRDATDEETLNTLAWLSALSLQPSQVSRLGFSLTEHDPDSAASFRLPVLVNTVNSSLVCWLSCLGKVRVGDGGIEALSVKDVVDVRLEVSHRLRKTTKHPEFVMAPQVIIARGRESWEQVQPHSADWSALGLRDLELV
jgi:hypothetical protein